MFLYFCIRKSYPNKQSNADHGSLDGCQFITENEVILLILLISKRYIPYAGLVEIFCIADDFCKELEKNAVDICLKFPESHQKRSRPCRMSESKIITILICFHMG